ncbi:DUF2798 domain-containing protein [Vibrio fluvialis]|nr:DUF2798 domain-containing protein [Vibrio fluvialis]
MSRKQFWLTALMSSFVMALIMSGVLSGYKLGFNAQWPPIWLNGFTIAWPLALLLNLTVLPQIRNLAAWLSRPHSGIKSHAKRKPSLKLGFLFAFLFDFSVVIYLLNIVAVIKKV